MSLSGFRDIAARGEGSLLHSTWAWVETGEYSDWCTIISWHCASMVQVVGVSEICWRWISCADSHRSVSTRGRLDQSRLIYLVACPSRLWVHLFFGGATPQPLVVSLNHNENDVVTYALRMWCVTCPPGSCSCPLPFNLIGLHEVPCCAGVWERVILMCR